MKKVLFYLCVSLLVLSLANYGLAQMGCRMMGGGQSETPQSSLHAISASEIFSANCANCHPNGSNIVVPNLPLIGCDQLKDFKTFLGFIRQPKMPDGSEGAMPAFPSSKISDEQATRLYQLLTDSAASGVIGGCGMYPGMMGGCGMGFGAMGRCGSGRGM